MNRLRSGTAAAMALWLAACSPERAETSNLAVAAKTGRDSSTAGRSASQPFSPAPTPARTLLAADVLTIEGLGDLKIGEPVPRGSSWSEHSAQIPGPCRTVSTPDFPGTYAIIEEGRVRRITLGERSKVTLVEGIGAGSDEAEVLAAFPGFREEPHKYMVKPAKYLTAPNASGRDPALRFEISRDGKVSLMHLGTMPTLGYVEGCA